MQVGVAAPGRIVLGHGPAVVLGQMGEEPVVADDVIEDRHPLQRVDGFEADRTGSARDADAVAGVVGDAQPGLHGLGFDANVVVPVDGVAEIGDEAAEEQDGAHRGDAEPVPQPARVGQHVLDEKGRG